MSDNQENKISESEDLVSTPLSQNTESSNEVIEPSETFSSNLSDLQQKEEIVTAENFEQTQVIVQRERGFAQDRKSVV